MEKAQNVIRYYVICNQLKNLIRTGWKDWHVNRERVESVAEHVYGVQMLALAMYSEYEYPIDIMKVLFMLAIHEVGEVRIGDLTQFEISPEEKKQKEQEAVSKILNGLLKGKEIEQLFLEFDERKTPEAFFAYQCDKLECDLQSKLYDEEGCVNLKEQEGNQTLENKKVQLLLEQGLSWSEMWLRFGQETYPYDEHFREVSNYAMNHSLKKQK